MNLRSFAIPGASLAILASVCGAADPASGSGRSGRGGTAKGIFPDPVLLDGSSQSAEKKSEVGILGNFEIAGDENAQPSSKEAEIGRAHV